MKAILLVVAVALVANVAVAQYCSGLNITMNPGTFNPLVGAASGVQLTQQCPFGFTLDQNQGRCVTYRQIVNNYYLAPCYTNADCGPYSSIYALPSGSSGNILGCGAKKFCTWINTRAQNDTCDDNLNCVSYTGTDYTGVSKTVYNGCDVNSRTCAPIVNVTVATGAACGYVNGTQYFVCDAANWCYNNTIQPSPSITGAGICMPLTPQGQKCSGKLNCAGGLYCGGLPVAQAVNYTCTPLLSLGSTCYQVGQTFECSQTSGSAYCSTTSTPGAYTCQTYQPVGGNCTGLNAVYLSTQPKQCAMGLRCLQNLNNLQYQCFNPVGYNDTMGCVANPAVFTAPNCTTGLTCVSLGGTLGNRCITGALNDPCAVSGAGTNNYKDSCQWQSSNLYCNTTVGGLAAGTGTCIPRVATGVACGYLQQCMPGLQCYNGTVCKAYQTLGQPCNNLDIDSTQYLVCQPDLLCSRGTCIQNFTVSIGGLCSQDRDCDTGVCDTNFKRCTQRRLCGSNADCGIDGTTGAPGKCVCSSGAENMGQCVFDNCDRQRINLINCLNPLFYDRYFVNGSYLVPAKASNVPATYAFLDSGSSFYQKCSGQHNDFVRCQGLMAKWGAPAVPLGDLLNYGLATISASSTVSMSVMVMVAFIMSAFMYL